MMNMSGFRHWLIVPTRTEAAPASWGHVVMRPAGRWERCAQTGVMLRPVLVEVGGQVLCRGCATCPPRPPNGTLVRVDRGTLRA